jgi:hypothetical protein
VNRTPSRTSAVDADYATWSGSVAVPKGDVVTVNAEIEYIGGSNPDSYIDD